MDAYCREILWNQFGAAIDTLDAALRACPPGLWNASLWEDAGAPPGLAQYWYVAYHTLFWLDLYLDGRVEGFAPPAPFGLEELDPAGLLPPRAYTPEELHAYLAHCRDKCRAVTGGLTEEDARRVCAFPWGAPSFGELLLDNLRHVQEHAAQLNMFLGQQAGLNSRWLARVQEG